MSDHGKRSNRQRDQEQANTGRPWNMKYKHSFIKVQAEMNGEVQTPNNQSNPAFIFVIRSIRVADSCRQQIRTVSDRFDVDIFVFGLVGFVGSREVLFFLSFDCSIRFVVARVTLPGLCRQRPPSRGGRRARWTQNSSPALTEFHVCHFRCDCWLKWWQIGPFSWMQLSQFSCSSPMTPALVWDNTQINNRSVQEVA